MSTSIDYTYLIFCGLKLNVRREGEERKGKERKGGKSLSIEVKSMRKYLAVGLVYRSSSGSIPLFLKILEEVLDSV